MTSKQVTSPPWNSRRGAQAKKWFGHCAGRSPCAHSIGKFFLCYIVLFLLETSAPGLSGHYWYIYIFIYTYICMCLLYFVCVCVCQTGKGGHSVPFMSGIVALEVPSLSRTAFKDGFDQFKANWPKLCKVPTHGLILPFLGGASTGQPLWRHSNRFRSPGKASLHWQIRWNWVKCWYRVSAWPQIQLQRPWQKTTMFPDVSISISAMFSYAFVHPNIFSETYGRPITHPTGGRQP